MRRIPLIIFCIIYLAVLVNARDFSKNGEVVEEIIVLKDQLTEHIDNHNFQAARETIEALIPLMKDQLKEDKKLYGVLKKAQNPETDPNTFKSRLDRKNELFDSLKNVIESSQAALRVKSDQIQKNVEEFVNLS